MGVPGWAAALAGVCIALSGCGADGVTSGGAVDSTTSSSTAPVGAIELAQECEADAYRVRYPAGWSTNKGDVVRHCRFFHPEPFIVPPATEVFGLAVMFDLESVPFPTVLEGAGAPAEEVLDQRDVVVDGRRGVRLETRAIDDGLVPSGTPSVRYLVRFDGATLVASTYGLSTGDHQRNRDVLDAMMTSLRVKASPGCSAAELAEEATPQPALPEPVAKMRDAIVAAATACDLELLAQLASAGQFSHSFGGDGDPAAYWRRLEAERDPLRILVQLINGRHATRPVGDGAIQYVWPRAYAFERWAEVPQEVRDELAGVYGPERLEDFSRAGSYTGHRIGIAADGDWLFFVAGD